MFPWKLKQSRISWIFAVLVVFLALQKHFVKGVTLGSIK